MRNLLRQAGLLFGLLLLGIVLVGMIPPALITGAASYPALHTILEVGSIGVAFLIFATGWVAVGRPQPISTAIVIVAFLGVGLIDLLHTLSYQGMPDLITPSDPEKAINFWLIARLLSGLALLQLVLWRSAPPASQRLRIGLLMGILLFVAGVAWVGLWRAEWFPRTFLPETGLTPFKIAMEYLIAAILLGAALILLVQRRLPSGFRVSGLLFALISLFVSSLCFTLYSDVTDGYNLLGHGYKIIAALFLYYALFVGVIRAPYDELTAAYERLKQERRAFEASEARFRALDSSIEEVIFTLDRSGRHTDIYGRWLQRLNMSADHFLGRTAREIMGPEAAVVHEAANARALAGESLVYEWTTDGPQGVEYYETSLAPLRDADGMITGVIGLGRNVTTHRMVSDELAQRNNELALLNRVVAASAVTLAPEAILATVGDELAQTFSVTHAVALFVEVGEAHPQIVLNYQRNNHEPMVQPALMDLFTQVATTQTSIQISTPHAYLLALPVIADGQVLGMVLLALDELRWSADAVRLAESVISHAAGAIARARLTQAHHLLSVAQEQAGESTLILNADGIIRSINPAFERLSGYSISELRGQSFHTLKGKPNDPTFFQTLRGTLARGDIWRGQLRQTHRDGSTYTVEATIAPITNPDGVVQHYVAVMRDVTRELQLEEQFHQAQKMEAVGRLAGGIAHDFNNLLSVINGYSEFVLEAHPDPKDPVRQDIEAIWQAGTRAARLTKQLLAFSRRQTLEPQLLNLNEVLIELEQMLTRMIGEDIHIVMRCAPDLWPIWVDRGQLEQVLMNLAVNARDAMPHGGTLTFITSNQEHAGEAVVRLEVVDTGMGMSQQTLEHLFEPFYTTKAPGRGTGLGLATVHGIVNQSGGAIMVQSALGSGTRFIIHLPRSRQVMPGNVTNSRPETLPRGHETILLVEDEAHIRILAARVLRSQGYTVIEAPNASEALQLHANSPQIDLLLTDLVLPGMHGAALAQRLLLLQPGLRILFMSGDPERITAPDLPPAQILMKPVRPHTLIMHVRNALKSAPAV